MNGFLLGCFGGFLWVQHSATLPSAWVLTGVGLLILWACARARGRWALLLLCTLLGVNTGAAYATMRAQWRLDARLPSALDGQDVHMTGVVTGLPAQRAEGVRFLFSADPQSEVTGLPPRMQLSWYATRDGTMPPALTPGDRLELSARLRRPTSQFNPGGFDRAGWSLAQGIGASGYVRSGQKMPDVSRFEASLTLAIDRLRDRLRHWIGRHTDGDIAPLLIAMAVGDQGSISEDQWNILRNTGTAHLVAISGLHVSIVAFLAAGWVSMIWRRIPGLALRLPAGRAAIIGGMLMALMHGALAGYGIPVMRAVIMLSVATMATWRTRHPPAGRVLLLALVCVLLFDPWAVLSAGFWLSFGAVAALLLVLAGRAGTMGRARQFLRSQWAIGLLSAPLLLAAFGQISLAAPLANLVAIPVVSLMVVPALLLACVCQATTVLAFAAFTLELLMAFLAHLAAWPLASWSGAVPPVLLLAVAALGAAVLLLPRGTPARGLGLGLLVAVLAWSPARPRAGRFDVRVFDVGQGLAVHIRTAAHDLMYDAGRSYFRGGDAGRSVVLPALRHDGIGRLDRLVLSHDDSDHTGGANSLRAAMPIAQVTAGAGVRLSGVDTDACVAGERWTWDGVHFAWLHPSPSDRDEDDNNRSCVLRVWGDVGSLLLTGDIQQMVEARLVAAHRLAPTEVVVAPHHGSKSSSSEALIDAVRARHVVFSAGFDNPYHHPAPAVVTRWRAAGAQAWDTADDGMIDIAWDAQGAIVTPYAQERRRYWHRMPP